MTRVWLTEWEWACCGDPFVVGDDVDFGLASRGEDAWLVGTLGADLAATVDGVESHHVEEFPDRLRGRVVAVHAVIQEFVERRVLRRPGRGAPSDATMPVDGEEWPAQGSELGGDFWVAARPTRYMLESSPVPDSARLLPVPGVRQPPAGPDESASPVREYAADPPPERRTRETIGWLVDVEES